MISTVVVGLALASPAAHAADLQVRELLDAPLLVPHQVREDAGGAVFLDDARLRGGFRRDAYLNDVLSQSPAAATIVQKRRRSTAAFIGAWGTSAAISTVPLFIDDADFNGNGSTVAIAATSTALALSVTALVIALKRPRRSEAIDAYNQWRAGELAVEDPLLSDLPL